MTSQTLPAAAPPASTRFVLLSAAAAVVAATAAYLSLLAALPVWAMFMGWVTYNSRGRSAGAIGALAAWAASALQGRLSAGKSDGHSNGA